MGYKIGDKVKLKDGSEGIIISWQPHSDLLPFYAQYIVLTNNGKLIKVSEKGEEFLMELVTVKEHSVGNQSST